MTDTPDNRITQALSDDDREFLDSLEAERGLFTQIGDTWKGPMGGWAKLLFAFSVVMGVMFLFVIWQLAHSTNNATLHTLWAIAGLALLILLGFAKEWIFNRMNMLTLLREVKRVQLEVVALQEELANRNSE
ncbi:MAG: DUF6768 family protein [Pseudomonadota bacterium]